MQDRVILHCDCNSFFASVETVLNPNLKNVPMAVCGDEENRHGIVLAKNELAKSYGIKTAETVFSAKKKCPSLVTVPPTHKAYLEFSRRANEIYNRYTDLVESFGIDESWLDVTASRKIFGDGYEIAKKISYDIKNELGITVSIGVSFNKVFAKLGSDYKKPDAITVIDRFNFKNIVFPLPVSTLLFVGKKTEASLYSMGIRTIGELAATSRDILRMKFGKAGDSLFDAANGLEESPVDPHANDDVKSISNGYTFKHDLVGRDECKIGIEYLAEEIGSRLRRKGLKCCTVQLTIKDKYLRTLQRQRPQIPPSDIGTEIAETAFSILSDEWSSQKPIRMLTVTATNLIRDESYSPQLSLFDTPLDKKREKKKNEENTVDKIRQKYGNSAIVKGAVLDTDLGIYTARKKKND